MGVWVPYLIISKMSPALTCILTLRSTKKEKSLSVKLGHIIDCKTYLISEMIEYWGKCTLESSDVQTACLRTLALSPVQLSPRLLGGCRPRARQDTAVAPPLLVPPVSRWEPSPEAPQLLSPQASSAEQSVVCHTHAVIVTGPGMTVGLESD